MTAHDYTVAGRAIFDRRSAGAFAAVNPRQQVTGLYRIAEIDAGFEQTVMLGKQVSVGLLHIELDAGLGGLDSVRVEYTGMHEKIVYAAPGDFRGVRGTATTATEFGRDENLAHGLGLGVVHAAGIDFQQAQKVGRGKSAGCCLAGSLLVLVLEFVVGGKRQKLQRLAAGVDIEHVLTARKQLAREVIGDQ